MSRGSLLCTVRRWPQAVRSCAGTRPIVVVENSLFRKFHIQFFPGGFLGKRSNQGITKGFAGRTGVANSPRERPEVPLSSRQRADNG
jgi:hypothetical protein